MSRTLSPLPWLTLAITALASAPALAQEPPTQVDIKALSRKLDNLYRAKTSKGVMKMVIITPHYKRTLTMEMTTRGLDDTLIRIKSPRKEKGISTLKRGNEMWNYLPKVRKVIRVPPSMMTSSWMGSDVTNDDLVRDSSWENDYTITQIKAPTGDICLQSVPKESAAVTWSKVVSCFDAATQLPKLQEFYDEKGRKVRKVVMDQVADRGGRKIPTRTTIIPLSGEKKGNKTIMTIEKMEYDVAVPSTTFSTANLRRGR